MSRTLTIEATSPNEFITIPYTIERTKLTLVSYRVDLDSTSTKQYRQLGISMGNIVGNSFTLNSNPMSNLFRLPLEHNANISFPDGAGGSFSAKITSVTNCNIPLVMNEELQSTFEFRVNYVDRITTPTAPFFTLVPAADLKYISMTFVFD